MKAHSQPHASSGEFALLSGAAVRGLAILIGFVMFSAPRHGVSAERPASKEYGLKAAFIYNFTKFVEWPADKLQDTNAPFVVAVAGNSPCTAELEQIAKERKVNGRTLVIKTIKTYELVKDAHVLFVPAAEDGHVRDWLTAARGAGVLTIGESEAFAKHGGMINFLLEGEKIRFEINVDPADAVGLKLSAQLQKLAKTVRRK